MRKRLKQEHTANYEQDGNTIPESLKHYADPNDFNRILCFVCAQETCHELGQSYEETITRIINRLGLSKEDAQKKMLLYWS